MQNIGILSAGYSYIYYASNSLPLGVLGPLQRTELRLHAEAAKKQQLQGEPSIRDRYNCVRKRKWILLQRMDRDQYRKISEDSESRQFARRFRVSPYRTAHLSNCRTDDWRPRDDGLLMQATIAWVVETGCREMSNLGKRGNPRVIPNTLHFNPT